MLEKLRAALAGRYDIAGEFTRGGMAVIYRAEDLKHGRAVAIKVFQPDLVASVGPERFLREIEIAARLNHPHILPLLDSGDADGLPYYVMPYVPSDTLRKRLGREPSLSIPDVTGLLRQILDALGYAHAEGVIHRDIKPENVMVAGRNAMLIDFGVAKAMSLATLHVGRPTLGTVLGTPEYISPEQAASRPDIDHRTDIYAVGAMTYELLTGSPPFTHQHAQHVLAAQIHQAPRPITEHRPLPPHLAELVMRSLKKRPSERWQTADDMLAQLDRDAPGGVPARPIRTPLPQPGRVESSERAERRWAGAILLGVIAALILALMAAAVVVMLRPIGLSS